MFKVGDKVIDGEGCVGIVTEILGPSAFPVKVIFEDGSYDYTYKGQFYGSLQEHNYDIRHLTPLEELL